MVGVLRDPALYQFIGGEPPTLAQLRARYEQQAVGRSADGSEVWRNWIVRRAADGIAVGTVQATETDAGRAADVAWVIGVEWQRGGYATEAAEAMIAWLVECGVTEFTAHVHPEHTASNVVAERLGLVPSAEFDDDGERLWRLTP
jgi:RimJ/RimL family protein N-acetyltransferase